MPCPKLTVKEQKAAYVRCIARYRKCIVDHNNQSQQHGQFIYYKANQPIPSIKVENQPMVRQENSIVQNNADYDIADYDIGNRESSRPYGSISEEEELGSEIVSNNDAGPTDIGVNVKEEEDDNKGSTIDDDRDLEVNPRYIIVKEVEDYINDNKIEDQQIKDQQIQSKNNSDSEFIDIDDFANNESSISDDAASL